MRTVKQSRNHYILAGAVAITVLTGVYAGAAMVGDNNDRRGPETYSVALFGDMPYKALGRAQYPPLLAESMQVTSRSRCSMVI
jgi:hypothetical protein